jgi:hypothetical protein
VDNPVAALEVVALVATGERVTLTAQIGKPYRNDDGSWSCPVAMPPLYAQLEDIRGIDSFHATWLACSLILKLLEHFKASGGELVYGDGSEFPLDAYLRGLEAKPPAAD